jgi:serpin B
MRQLRMSTVPVVMALASLGLGGCGEEAQPPDESLQVRSELARDTAPAATVEEVDALVAGSRDFGMDLYHRLAAAQEEPGNLACSPYSLSVAMAMTWAGARGDTEREIGEVMGFTLPQAEQHRAFNWLDLELASREAEAPEAAEVPFSLSLASSAWAQRGFPFEADYLDVLAVNYDAGLYVTDFASDPEAARSDINAWTSDRTAARIPEVLPEGALDANTKLVLVNAIYFAAEWLQKFPDEYTADGAFHALDGGELVVPMMHNSLYAQAVEGSTYQALSLPYQGEELDMVIVLPAEGAFASFEASLDGAGLGTILDALAEAERTTVEVAMPSFDVSGDPIPLVDVLSDMGMPDAFVPGTADFSGIAQRPMWIDNVYHRAFVKVDERGTEAAAASAVVIDSDGDPDPDPVVFTADRPFVFLVRDIATGAVLFLGRMADPS